MAAGGKAGNLSLFELKSGKIVPDVVSQLSRELLDLVVQYRDVEVENGTHMRVTQTEIKPHVELSGKGFGGDNVKWTLLMMDPDAPSPEAPEYRNFLHWIVVNIPGSTAPNQEIWETGKEVTPYMSPAPSAGLHRYVFLLFRQEKDLQVKNSERPKFDVNAFAKDFNLGDCRGAVYFVAKHGDDFDYPGRQA